MREEDDFLGKVTWFTGGTAGGRGESVHWLNFINFKQNLYFERMGIVTLSSVCFTGSPVVSIKPGY